MESIKTNFEFPRGDDPLKQGQRLAQDLSANFKALSKNLSKITENVASINSGNTFTQNFTYTGGNQVYNYTFTHGLGTTPTSFQISDFITNVGGTQYEHYTFIRTAWTSTQISVKLSYYNGLGSGSGTFVLKVLG